MFHIEPHHRYTQLQSLILQKKTESWFWGSASIFPVWAWDSRSLLWPLLGDSARQEMCSCSEAQGAGGPPLLLLTAFPVYQTRWTNEIFHWPGFRRRWSGPGCGAWPRSEVEILVALAHGALPPPLPAVAATNRQKNKNYKLFSQTNQGLLLAFQPVKQCYSFKAQHLNTKILPTIGQAD